MTKRLLLTLALLPMLFMTAFAQERTVSGVVTDNGEPLPGVTVILKGTSKGTITGLDGDFKLAVPGPESILEFRFVGYKTKEVAVGNQSALQVPLEVDAEELEEVVVTALGVSRDERSLGYAMQAVGGDELSEVKSTNVVSGLAGKVSGVQINSSSTMGGSSRILIRGANSINGNNQPLFVVDGVPLDNSNFTSSNQERGAGGYDYGNAAQDINPDDIASMSVLKGAAAAALYGSRAANGVIIITTKSGKGRKGIGVSINAGVTFDNILRLPDYQNSYGGGGAGAFGSATDANGNPYASYAVDESWGPKLDGTPARQWYSFDEWHPDYGQATAWEAHPNNVKDFFETGVTTNTNVALSGGNDVSNFRLSYTNMDINGVMPNSEMTRHTVSFNGSTKLTDKFTVSTVANYVSSKALGRPGTGYDGGNVMQQFNQWGQRQWDNEQMKQYKNPDGSQRTWNRRGYDDGRPKYADNPYWTRYENYQDDDRERFFGNFALNYKINENFSVSGKVMTDFYTDSRRERIAVGSVDISKYSEDVRFVKENNYEAMLRYDKTFDSEFSVNAFVGGNIRKQSYKRNYGTTVNGLSVAGLYTLSNSNSPAQLLDDGYTKQVNSAFASTSFGYRNTYFLDATMRVDQSSTLPTDNNTYFYPSVTGSFVFSELEGLNNSSILSFGKLRAGFAEVGNDTDPYNILTTYSADTRGSFGNFPLYTVPNTLNNVDLKPETTRSFEVGVDSRFLNDRIGLDVTYYRNTTFDQILDIATSAASGYSRQYINAGEMLNHGLELMLYGTPVQTASGFKWDVTVNWAKNMNEVVELYTDPETGKEITNLRLANAPFAVSVNAFKGESYGQIVGTGYVYDDNGNKVVNEDGTYKVTDGVVNLGSSLAKWTGGINNTFSYKGISLRTLLDVRYGGKVFSTTNMWGKYSGIMEETAANGVRENGLIVEGVNEDGTPNTTVIDANTHFFANGGYTIAEADVYDASYVKLKELALSYKLPNKLVSNYGINNVTFSVVGRNLAILYSELPHLDPEVTASAGNIQGIEGAQVPSTRSIGFNVKFDF
ncbi:SusC/RagA family TonB-linked outer membrane protein [Limibacter armeniacum]|uniref:SusC/RagA family TonB-linked outer membrane protein n=1 Tax=Limibacter armeniacum TaxID=466084 RepID=UPI002FE6350C